MTIATGQRLPDATFKSNSPDGPKEMTTAEIFAGRKVVLFGVPGAFTPTCNKNHLPGYIENRDAILSRGVDEIAVVAVNDVFVMSAWAQASGGDGKLLFLADGSGDFAKAAGLDIDLGKAGLGLRMKRFSAIIDDGVVTALNIEDAPGSVVTSGAATILEQL